MTVPSCDLCKHKHWPREGHVWDKEEEDGRDALIERLTKKVAELEGLLAKQVSQAYKKRDRREYMRLYMQKRRKGGTTK